VEKNGTTFFSILGQHSLFLHFRAANLFKQGGERREGGGRNDKNSLLNGFGPLVTANILIAITTKRRGRRGEGKKEAITDRTTPLRILGTSLRRKEKGRGGRKEDSNSPKLYTVHKKQLEIGLDVRWHRGEGGERGRRTRPPTARNLIVAHPAASESQNSGKKRRKEGGEGGKKTKKCELLFPA